MFLHLSVSHSVHGGVSRPTTRGEVWGVWPGGCLQADTQGGSWGVWPGESPGPQQWESWGVWPGGVSRSTTGGEEVGGSGQGGLQAHTQGDGSQHAWGRPPPAKGYCCGQYASYWNAFLFVWKSSTFGTLFRSLCVWSLSLIFILYV